MSIKPKVIVIGSGLSGMAAAIDLVDADYDVHILEKNHIIGGRTSSWNADGMQIESGLHRYLGVYRALPKLLRKAGVRIDEMLCWEDEAEIRVPDGAQAVLGVSMLHKPWKTIWAALGHNDFYTLKEKLALGKMFAAGIKDYTLHPEELDTYTALEYAVKHHVSARVIERVLKPLTEGILFMPIGKYSAYNMFGLFVPFMPTLYRMRLGAFTGGMSEVMMQPLARYFTQRGGRITLGASVEKIETKNGVVKAVWANGERYKTDYVVLAASLKGAQDIIHRSFTRDPLFSDMLALLTMPTVTLHLELTEPSMSIDRTTFGPSTALASFAEQSRTTFRSSEGRLSVILSEPEHYIDKSEKEILQVVMDDAKLIGLDLHGKVKNYRVVYLPDDFYSMQPGSEALRPSQRTHIAGLVLAGDYTKQPHLATMEGAVVSGHAAAEVVRVSG